MDKSRILAVILAGGQAKRMAGQSKALIPIGPQSCFERVRDTFRAGNISEICVSYKDATQKSSRLCNIKAIYDLPITASSSCAAWAIYSVLAWAKQAEFDAVITSPVDVPFLPKHYVKDLMDAQAKDYGASVVCSSQGRLHGLNALWPLCKFETVQTLIRDQGVKSLQSLHARLGSLSIAYEATTHDPFYNVNTPNDLSVANQLSLKHNI